MDESKFYIGDLVKTSEGRVAVVTKCSHNQGSVNYSVKPLENNGGIWAWWDASDLELIERGPASKYGAASWRK